MKLVVAGRTGMYVDTIFNNLPDHNGASILVASLLYPFQIYADLGGYTLIAIGAAKILGFNVMCNFNRPFFAVSMAEFWRRWHISLITWLTDYVYTPLSFHFRKKGVWGVVIALMITFLISGIWHGAAITFIVWGLMQGLFLSIEALTNKRKSGIEKRFRLTDKVWYIFLGCIITYLLFAFSLILSRVANINEAMLVYSRILEFNGPVYIGHVTPFLYSILGISMIILTDFRDEYFPSKLPVFENRYFLIRILAYVSLILLIMTIGIFDDGQFIYFKF